MIEYGLQFVDLNDRDSVVQAIEGLQKDVMHMARTLEGLENMTVMLLGRLGGEATFTREQLKAVLELNQHVDYVHNDHDNSMTIRLL